MKSLKNFYRSYSNHFWLLVLTLLFDAACSILFFNNPKPLVWGMTMFVLGPLMIYLVVRLSPLGQGSKCFICYMLIWFLCIALSAVLMILWGLYIPHEVKSWFIVVVVLLWYTLMWLLGMFFIHMCNVFGDID